MRMKVQLHVNLWYLLFSREILQACSKWTCSLHQVSALCFFPLGAVAFCFFAWWHLDIECKPSLATCPEWINLKIDPGRRGPTKEMPWNSYLEAMKKCPGSPRMISGAKTHIETGSGGQLAYLGDTTERDIRCLGRRNFNTLAGFYLHPFLV